MNSPLSPQLYVLDASVDRTEMLRRLAAMPGQLRKALSARGPSDLVRSASSDAWSAFQVVCHMRDAVLVYSGRFRWIVFNDEPLLPDYDENNWVGASLDTLHDLPQMLDYVAASRVELCRLLERLNEAAWQRTGRHETLGTVMLEDYVRHQVAHETMHLAQIRAALTSP